MKPETRSLRHQLLRWLLALLIPLLALGAINSYWRAHQFTNRAYDRSLLRAALALADQVIVVQGDVLVDLPKKALDLLEYDKDDWIYYKVIGPLGNTVAGEPFLLPPPVLPLAGGHIYYEMKLGEGRFNAVAYALQPNGMDKPAVVTILVAETRSKRMAVATEITLPCCCRSF